jgi:hypothetical protein
VLGIGVLAAASQRLFLRECVDPSYDVLGSHHGRSVSAHRALPRSHVLERVMEARFAARAPDLIGDGEPATHPQKHRCCFLHYKLRRSADSNRLPRL